MIGNLVRCAGALVLGIFSSLILGVLGEGLFQGKWHSMYKFEATMWGISGLGAVGGVWYLVGFRWVLAVLGAAFGVGISARKLG